MTFALCATAAAVLSLPLIAASEGRQAISPPGSRIVGPYSPGMLAGDSLYIAGQGARREDGTIPATASDQLVECLRKIQVIAGAAGLTTNHLAYAQVFVSDPSVFPEVEAAWAKYFPHGGPARTLLGVSHLPDDTPVEVNAVAARDVTSIHAVRPESGNPASVPDAMLAGERLYLSDCRGASVEEAMDRLGVVLKAASMDYRNMVFVNPFMTSKVGYEAMNRVYARRFEFGNTPARATIVVSALPGGANIQFTGVAVRDVSMRHAVRPKNMPPSPTASPCVLADQVLYCSAKSGFIPGPNSGVFGSSVEEQVRQTMRNLLDGLEEAGMSFADVVSSNVYLDDIADFPKMNRIYKLFFKDAPPVRTTLQQKLSIVRTINDRNEWPDLEQISIIAVKP